MEGKSEIFKKASVGKPRKGLLIFLEKTWCFSCPPPPPKAVLLDISTSRLEEALETALEVVEMARTSVALCGEGIEDAIFKEIS